MAAAAGSLEARGLGPGDRVAFCVASSADLLCAVLGASLVGIVPVVLSAQLLEAEREALLADADAAHQVLDGTALGDLFTGPTTELAALPLTRPMLFTSGTTGHPKGVTVGVWSEAQAAAVFDDERSVWHFDETDVHLVNSPLHHSVATRFAAGTLLSGGEVILTSHFDAPVVLDLLRSGSLTTTFLAPAHLQRLFDCGALGVDETFEGLRFVAHAGAPCPAPLKRAAIERFGAEALVEFYGSTEGQFTVCSTPEWLERPGTVGRARAGRRLFLGPLDDEAGEQPDGVGTIWCEAPSFARFEYFGDPMSTSWAWAGDAFSVGDLGRLDEAGYLFLSGRRSDLIITGGVNVYPAEIEEVLGHLVGVLEVCAFGLDDERWGQRVCVAVVGAPGLRPADVADHAAATLAPFKRPKEIHLVTELPVGPTGKVLRRALPGLLGVA